MLGPSRLYGISIQFINIDVVDKKLMEGQHKTLVEGDTPSETDHYRKPAHNQTRHSKIKVDHRPDGHDFKQIIRR